MEVVQPRVRVVRRRCAPRRYPCPQCGRRGRRKQTHTRQVRDLAYGEVLLIELTVGEYRARCGCCKTFRSPVEGIEPRAAYTNRVREAVLDRLLDDGMSGERLRRALRRDFHLDLSDGFLYDCLDWKVRQVNLPAYRQWTREHFSGTLCIDEVHLGRRTLLLATDPLGDFPVAFALVGANDQAHLRRFLQNLRAWGFAPRVVVTDGSGLYPALLAEVWPEAAHQLCVFHVLKDINAHILDEARRLRRQLASRGRAGQRGRPRKGRRRGLSARQKAHFVFKHRHLLVKRRQRLRAAEVRALRQLFDYLPALATLWRFADEVYQLFGGRQSPHRAWCLRAALVKRPAYQAYPGLVAAIGMLEPDKFAKMIAFLSSPVHRRVRTNNHVERTNRKLRYWEKVRYKWRRRRSIVRFVVLALDRQWQRTAPEPARQPQAASTRPRAQRLSHRPKPAT
jgi:Transposase